MASIPLPPRPKPTTYDKGIQTSAPDDDVIPKGGEFRSNDSRGSLSDDDGASYSRTTVATEAEIRARIIREIEMQREIERLKEQDWRQEQELKKDEVLTKADLVKIYGSDDFQSFLDSSSKILERALNDNYDYLRDYSIGDGDAGASAD